MGISTVEDKRAEKIFYEDTILFFFVSLCFIVMVNRVIIIVTTLIMLGACSVKKNTWRSRAWHNVNSEFNVKFNGGESFKQGIKKAESHQVADYAELLPVFIFADEGIPGQVTGDMERAIDKSNKLVTKHSITVKPKKKKGAMSKKEREFYNRREFNSVVDDAYLLSAKASLYLQNYVQAIAALDYLLLEFPKASAVNEAKIWLAVALTNSGDVERVPALLDEVSREKKLSRYKRSIMRAAYANYHIRQQQYAEAATDLEKALKVERRKANKIRYRFVLANLYSRLNEPSKAGQHLERIIKLSREYEQVFSARLMLASAYDPSSKRDIRKALLRMLDDEKNKDYADRIYFALAQAERAAGNDAAAVSYLQKSIAAEESHPRQRGYAYEMLGNYYHNGKDYAGAYDNLMSAAEALGASYSRYTEIYDKALSLEKVAKNWKIVHLQDSLQRIAKMPASERDKLIDEIINKIIEEERKAAEEQRYQQLFINQQEQARYSNTLLSKNTSGQWYFYNVNSINTGRGAFNMRWGKRRLEDNWRRKDRSDLSAIGTDEEEEGEETDKKTELSNKSREYYLRDLPLTPEAMEASNNKLRPALFGLGEAYMNDVHELQMAINTFEDLNRRFNKHEFLASTYYYLYKLYNELNNLAQSEHYKKLLITEYPQEPLAQMLANPNYLKEQQTLHDNIETLYAEAFNLYRTGKYAEASQVAAQINERYPQNLIQSQIALLRAFTMAQTGSIGAYKRALADIVKQHPTSDAAKTATNLLSVLDESVLKYNTALQQSEQPAVAVAEDTSSAKVKYVLNLDGEHYFGILFDRKQSSNELLFAIETHNADRFLDENYETAVRELPKGYAMVVVKTFADGQTAAQYAQLLDDDKILQPFSATAFRRLLITSENLELLAKTGEIVDYLDFFNMYYAHLFPKN
jgi:outer membrane protein assembly factor BamD (BamD/ComL family)